MDRASLEQMLGQGLSLTEIGRRFGRHEATVSYWLKKHGLDAANHEKHAARGGIAKEELERLSRLTCRSRRLRRWLAVARGRRGIG